MTAALDAYLLPERATIREAMQVIDRARAQIALAVDDDHHLVGVATDGDLRRALLGGAGMDDPVAPALTREFVALGPREGRAEALDLMLAHRIGAIPVIDDDGRPVGIHLAREFLEPVVRPNWAVVMAGGRGDRLRPLTDTVPKPMLRVAGRPILERMVLHLVGTGVKRIFLSVNYLGEVIEDHFGDGTDFGCSIEYLREEAPLGTAGALGLLKERPAEPILLVNGDLVTNADLGGLLDFHAAGGYRATVGVRRYVHTVPFGAVERDGDRITDLDEKPSIVRDVSTGMYALDPDVTGLVEPGVPLGMPTLLRRVLETGPVGAFDIEDEWVDVGQRDQLVRAREGS